MPGLGELAGLVAALCWSLTSLLMRVEARRADVIVLNALRTTAAAGYLLVLLGALGWLGLHAVTLGERPALGLALLLVSVTFAIGIGDSSYFLSMQRIGIARAMPLSMSYPLLTTLLAVPLLGEPVTPGLVAALVLIPIGLYLVVMPAPGRVVLQKADARALRAGLGLAMVAAVCWAVSAVTVRPALNQIDLLTATTIRITFAAGLVWLISWRGGRLKRPGQISRTRIGMALLGGTLSAGSMLLYLFATQQAGAARAATIGATSPLYAVPLSALFLGEHVTRRVVTGTLLTVLGVALLVSL